MQIHINLCPLKAILKAIFFKNKHGDPLVLCFMLISYHKMILYARLNYSYLLKYREDVSKVCDSAPDLTLGRINGILQVRFLVLLLNIIDLDAFNHHDGGTVLMTGD